MLKKRLGSFIGARTPWRADVSMQILAPKGNCFVFDAKDNGITEYTHFRAGSYTKLFTATAIMFLHERKLLGIWA